MKNKLLILAMLGIFSANFMHSDEVEEVVVQAWTTTSSTSSECIKFAENIPSIASINNLFFMFTPKNLKFKKSKN